LFSYNADCNVGLYEKVSIVDLQLSTYRPLISLATSYYHYYHDAFSYKIPTTIKLTCTGKLTESCQFNLAHNNNNTTNNNNNTESKMSAKGTESSKTAMPESEIIL